MEKLNPTNETGSSEEKKPSAIGGIIKKTLTAAGVAGITLGAMELKHSLEGQEKNDQGNQRETVEKATQEFFDIASLKNQENMFRMPSKLKFYFRSNIHNENGIKWVQLLASPYTNIAAVTANPAIIKFLEENPDEENAFIQKNEKGEMELVRENGEVVMIIE